MDQNSVLKKIRGLRLLPSKCKKKFWGKPQNLVGICFTSEILGNFKNAVCVTLWLFLGIVGLLGTFLVMWKLGNGNSLAQLGILFKKSFSSSSY